MSEPQIYDQLRLMLIAGHDTTASTIAWALLRRQVVESGQTPAPDGGEPGRTHATTRVAHGAPARRRP